MILWLERWGKWCCIFIINICLPFIPCFLTLFSILIFVVWLLKIQWLYQVLNVRVLLPFNYWSCWGCAGQSCGSSFRTSGWWFPRSHLHRTGQNRLAAKCPVCCSEMKFHDQLLQSHCWLSGIFLFLFEGHLHSIVFIRWWATIFFKYLSLCQVLQHLIPFTSYLAPGTLCTFTQDSDVPSGKQSVGGCGTHTYSYCSNSRF